MKKTRLVTAIVLFVTTLALIVAGECYVDNNHNERKLTKDEIKALQTVNVDRITKSVNQTSKLGINTNIYNQNTEDSLPINTTGETSDNQAESLIIEKNDSVKTTKKKSKKKIKNKKSKKKKSKNNYEKVGTFKVTGYCRCSRCCGKSTGITASGTVATAGRTIAADTSQFSFGSKVVINGHTYTVEDRGGAIKGNRIDIFFSSHQKALDWGVRYCDVYVKK